MRNYEVTFIVDPVLSGDEIKTTALAYEELLKNEGCSIVYLDDMGLKQLAYPINKRSSGVYYSIEFTSDANAIISRLELALRRDERIMRFLSLNLDRYGVKYNKDKRDGLIGKGKSKAKKSEPVAKSPPAKPPQEKPKSSPAEPVAVAVVTEEEE